LSAADAKVTPVTVVARISVTRRSNADPGGALTSA
jgi:hypothetical protein